MPSSKGKPGLADLKRLRQLAQAADTPAPAPAPPKRKRRKFMMGAQPSASNAQGRSGWPGVTEAQGGSDPPRATEAQGLGALSHRAPAGSHGTLPARPDPAVTGNLSPGAAQHTGATDGLTPVLPVKDRALFRSAVASVQPMPPPNRVILPPVPTAPPAILKQKRQAATGHEPAAPSPVSDQYAPARLAADASHFLQAGYGPDLLKKLERGHWPIEASLDLHGSTLDEARLRMDRFLSSCLQHSLRSVRVVHGKGHGSKNNAPVLKETVRRWLTQIEAVMAYVECAERDGGAGAVLVLLKAKEEREA